MMSEDKHTPEPWRPGKRKGTIVADKPHPEGRLGSDQQEQYHRKFYGGHLIAMNMHRPSSGNIARICACVNDCKGIPTTALEAGVVNRLRLSHAELLATLELRNASGPAIDEARALIAELGVEMASTTLSERKAK
jgi:hypothetical protein